MISRAELDELYRADDEARAEHAEWLARREAQARPFVRKSEDPAGLIFRTVENEPAPAAAADSEPSEADLAADDPLGYAVNEFAEAVERRFERLERENSFLRGQIDALLTMLGGHKAKNVSHVLPDDSVVDLPNFIQRRNDNAAA